MESGEYTFAAEEDCGRADVYLCGKMTEMTRSALKKIFESGGVTVNGRPAKASYDVKIGDIIEITFGEKKLKFEVTQVKETVGKDAASTLYRVLE